MRMAIIEFIELESIDRYVDIDAEIDISKPYKNTSHWRNETLKFDEIIKDFKYFTGCIP
jgi:hypothetical protein